MQPIANNNGNKLPELRTPPRLPEIDHNKTKLQERARLLSIAGAPPSSSFPISSTSSSTSSSSSTTFPSSTSINSTISTASPLPQSVPPPPSLSFTQDHGKPRLSSSGEKSNKPRPFVLVDSSSKIDNQSSQNSPKLAPLQDSLRRTSSNPSIHTYHGLPAAPSIVSLPMYVSTPTSTSVQSILASQAANSMQSVQAIPAFSTKKPLAPLTLRKGDIPPLNTLVDQDVSRRRSSSAGTATLHLPGAIEPLPDIPQQDLKNKATHQDILSDLIQPPRNPTHSGETESIPTNPLPGSIQYTNEPLQDDSKPAQVQEIPPYEEASEETPNPEEFTPFKRCVTSKQLNLFVGTWNMQGKPPPASVEPFITPNSYDIYAIATEECETTIQRALLSPPKQKWEEKLISTLGSDYIMMPSGTLGAVHLAIFVHRTLFPLISDVRTGAVTTGLGNVVANKGGVAIAFRFGATSMAFVAAHFTAHHNKVEQRNADYNRINTMLNLAPALSQDAQAQLQEAQSNSTSLVDQFDHVFWAGDLNYRINGNRRIVEETVKQGLIEVLVANDQLQMEKKKGNVFQGFLEGPLNFPPTYKYDPDSDEFDTSPKSRVPSWTDRILFKTSEHVTLREYTSCAGMRYTDHRPVYANFEVTFNPDCTASEMAGRGGSKVCTIL